MVTKAFRSLTIIFLAFFIISLKAQNGAGYEIKIEVNGWADTNIILGHYFGKAMYPDDTVRLNKKGIGVFQGKEKLPGGMYLVFMPNQRYFDFLLNDDQHFSIKTDTSNLSLNAVVEGSLENELFFNYQQYLYNKKQEANELSEKRKTAETEGEKNKIAEQLKSISEEVKAHVSNLIDRYPETFFSKFLLATKEIDVPDFPRDEAGNVLDSAFQYKYYRAHYFDNFDVGDPRLLRTPFYEEKLMTYIDKVVPQIPDTLIKETDFLLGKAENDENLFRYMLVTLFNHYAQSKIMGMDAVYVHLAENYYIPRATWSDPKFINDLKDRVAKSKPVLLGKVPANVEMVRIPKEHFVQAKNDTALQKYPYVGQTFKIHDIPADYTVLMFWEADCGHCKKALPALYKDYPELKEMGVEVIAINMLGGREGKQDWVKFINEYEVYDWINCWNPYDYSYKLHYDIYATPALYLLDKDKKIIAKRIGAEQIKEIVEFERKRKKQ